MGKTAIIQKLEKEQLKNDIPHFAVGDTIKVHTRIIEGNKERIQVFTGTVIARKGTGLSETFSVHRIAFGEGMERVFLLHSPRIANIEVIKHGDVRRAKLYYLRGTSGKAAKVKGRVGGARKAKTNNEAELDKEAVVEAEEAEVTPHVEAAPATEPATQPEETTGAPAE